MQSGINVDTFTVMIRFLFLLHRYLGIGIGLVMLLWTLSGVIMMYKPYPELNRWEALELKDTIRVSDCCVVPDSPILRSDSFSSLRVEMFNGYPVLRMTNQERRLLSLDLSSGGSFHSVDERTADAIAGDFVQSHYGDSAIIARETIDNDQWTVYSSYNPHRPLYRYTIDDPSGSQIYVSSLSGEIVQLTTAEQRFWGYLGAVIHWLYPTVLRQHTTVWSQLVIWLTLIGIFLTVTGVYIGLRQFRQRTNRRMSPYRGLNLFHHYAGLVFGLFILTWVVSGLFSMNPWGALEGEGARLESERLSGGALTWSDIEPILHRLDTSTLPPDSVVLEFFPLLGQINAVAYTRDGNKVRLNADTLTEEGMELTDIEEVAEALRPGEKRQSLQLLSEADRYYYVHHEPLEFPVYKVSFDDEQQRLYYLSAADGRIQLKIDADLRLYRWLFYALHRGDFSSLARSRPVWDLFMLALLAGVSVITATGTYMGWRRLKTGRRLRKSRLQRSSFQSAGL